MTAVNDCSYLGKFGGGCLAFFDLVSTFYSFVFLSILLLSKCPKKQLLYAEFFLIICANLGAVIVIEKNGVNSKLLK